jgi:hypothetical protein
MTVNWKRTPCSKEGKKLPRIVQFKFDSINIHDETWNVHRAIHELDFGIAFPLGK